MIPENADLETLRAFFARDRFATEACGARIVDAARGYALCEADITPVHRNAMGSVMGGALFTLADFALAVACNIGEEPTVSVSNTIEFLAAAKGTKLTAEARTDKSGKSLGFYTVTVRDDTGVEVARMMATCFRKGR